MTGTISAIIEAARSDDWVAVLEQSLAVWRHRRDPRLAQVVQKAQAHAEARFSGPKERTKEAFHQAWLRLALDDPSPVATGWLAARVSQLKLARGGFGVAETYDPILGLATESGDPALADALRTIAAAPRAKRAGVREYLKARVSELAVQLDAIPVRRLDDHDLAELGSLLPAPDAPSTRRTSAELLALVRQEPADEALRAVLGDVWIEEGDPRGDTVALERGARRWRTSGSAR